MNINYKLKNLNKLKQDMEEIGSNNITLEKENIKAITSTLNDMFECLIDSMDLKNKKLLLKIICY